ncbi:MAG: macro domain-containing protein [Phycisphaerae bacterium]
MDVSILDGDLLEQDVDVIVNAWNRNIFPWWLLLPQGVSRAIKRRGGYGPFRELANHGIIPLGGAVLTTAGNLRFKAIIHVAGINLLWRSSERAVRDSVRNAMSLAASRGFKSVAFPLIGAGTGGAAASFVAAHRMSIAASLMRMTAAIACGIQRLKAHLDVCCRAAYRNGLCQQ